jgi:uncharacterized radical SAM superfamily Fe-S cluster-containing enzyme
MEIRYSIGQIGVLAQGYYKGNIRMEECLRATQSLCPICNRFVEAKVLKDSENIILAKYCPSHGRTDALLAQNTYYKHLDEFYFSLMDKGKKRKEGTVELLITFRCNMNCPVCYLGEFKKQINLDPTLEELVEFIKTTKERKFILTGGEPTCREDVLEIIRVIKRRRKIVGMKTNGLKLADMDYVAELKKAGIDEVELQLSGTDSKAESYLRGEDHISLKLKALENLRKFCIPTRINALIAGGINENQLQEILYLALSNSFIKMINFGTMQFVGSAINFPHERYLMPDNLLRLLEEQTEGKIKRKHAYLFKKLEITLSTLFNRTTCLYNFIYLIIRDKANFNSIDKYIDLDAIEPYLNRYQEIYVHNHFLAKLYLFLISPLIMIFHAKSIKILKELFISTAAFLSKSSFLLRSNRLIYLLFTVECDPYRMDYSIYQNCPCKVVHFFDKFNGKFIKTRKPLESTDWLLGEVK